MKKILILLTLFISTLSLAGPGGGHSHGPARKTSAITKEKTEVIGCSEVERLVKSKKIDVSWSKSTFDKAILIKNEWVLTFDNKDGVKGERLYIFLKSSGAFVAANFTGK